MIKLFLISAIFTSAYSYSQDTLKMKDYDFLWRFNSCDIDSICLQKINRFIIENNMMNKIFSIKYTEYLNVNQSINYSPCRIENFCYYLSSKYHITFIDCDIESNLVQGSDIRRLAKLGELRKIDFIEHDSRQ